MTNPSGYPAAILRHWAIIVVLGILGVIGAFGYVQVATPVYSSTAQVLVAVQSDGTTTDRLQGASYIDAILPTYTSAVSSSLVLQPVITELKLDTTLDDFRKDVTATNATGTALLSITAKADTALGAQRIADAVTARFVKVAPGTVSPVAPTGTATTPASGSDAAAQAAVQQAANGTPAVVDLTTVDKASLPIAADSPKKLVTLALGLVAGLLAGVALALVRHAVDQRVRSEDVVERVVGAPVIGRIPRLSKASWPARDQDAAWSESVRSLRNAVFAWGDPVRVLQFTSATVGEGTTTVVASVARSLARAGVTTSVLDADLRAPSLQREFEVDGSRGLADVLTDSTELSSVVRHVPDLPSLSIVPGGTTTAAGDLVASDRLRGVIADLASGSAIVLVDSPAAVGTGDAQSISHLVTDVVLVVSLGSVTERVLARAVENLTASGTRVAGVVVMNAPGSSLSESAPRLAVGTAS